LKQTSPTEADIEAIAAELNEPPARARAASQRTSLLAYPATYLLVGINVLVFALMFRSGPVPELLRQHAWSQVLTAPFELSTLREFGGTASDLVGQGQWWRLLTGTFVHVTLLHLLLNMWCLWNLGLFGEPLLGRRGLPAVYLLTGTAGMTLSFALTRFARQDALVAGASGSVFGIAGILIVLLSNRRLAVPWEELRSLRRQVIFFAVANLAIGMAPGMIGMAPAHQLQSLHLDPAVLPRIDNSAHIGGFLSGLALGLPLFPRMTAGRSSYRARQRVTFAAARGAKTCLVGAGAKIQLTVLAIAANFLTIASSRRRSLSVRLAA
jgi:rhomboid protease GluP